MAPGSMRVHVLTGSKGELPPRKKTTLSAAAPRPTARLFGGRTTPDGLCSRECHPGHEDGPRGGPQRCGEGLKASPPQQELGRPSEGPDRPLAFSSRPCRPAAPPLGPGRPAGLLRGRRVADRPRAQRVLPVPGPLGQLEQRRVQQRRRVPLDRRRRGLRAQAPRLRENPGPGPPRDALERGRRARR